MTIATRHTVEIETLVFAIIGGIIGSFFLLQNNHQLHIAFPIATNSAQQMLSPQPSPTPPPVVANTSQISPDGTKKVLLNSVKDTKGTTYILAVDGSGDNQKKTIFTTTFSGSDTLHIPFNAWSPDDAYFYLVKNDNDAWIFKASGESFADGQYIDATNIFESRITSPQFDQATGWASPTLLVIETKTTDNTAGTSYWFEVPSKAIIPLATQF